MNYRTDHPDWPRLTSDQLEDKKRVGKCWVCTCPVCHTHHLNVDRQKGYFKCWYIGCEFRGILEDYRKDPEDNHRNRPADGRPAFRSRDYGRPKRPNDGSHGNGQSNDGSHDRTRRPVGSFPDSKYLLQRTDDGCLWYGGGYDEPETAHWQTLPDDEDSLPRK